MTRPQHGGRLRAAAARWNIPLANWLDLSTGINPHVWPIPELPAQVWQRLPEDEDGLAEILQHWLQAPSSQHCLPVAGSQAAIQALPRLRAPCRVAVPVIGYAEHGWAWQQAGHQVLPLTSVQMAAQLDQLDVVVWIQPNNPTAEYLPPEVLSDWQARLACRGGWLVVDEAFLMPGQTSLAPQVDREGLLVLRSLGKFFGLAGIRAGAVAGPPAVLAALADGLGPWALSGPSRHVMAAAVQDTRWQQMMAGHLMRQSQRLEQLLAHHDLPVTGATPLFAYIQDERAGRLAEQLARQGVLVRYFDTPQALRFGLPGSEDDWQRLDEALSATLDETH